MSKARIAWTGVLGVLVAGFAITYCMGRKPQTWSVEGETMGTTYTVKVVGASDTEHLAEEIASILDDVDRSMSTYKKDSEVSRFARHPAGEVFKISDGLREVLEVSREVYEASGGTFDPTVAPLVAAWGFGAGAHRVAPTDAELETLRTAVGFDQLTLTADGLTKSHTDVALDLSAVAKGYGVDRVAAFLDTLSARGYLVEVGGEVRVRGVNESGRAWLVGIEDPNPNVKGVVYRSIHLPDAALATSGSYRNFYERDGVRVSHTIDPRTARPVSHKLVSASVVASDCAHADAWATAMTVLGPDEGIATAVENDLAVLLLVEKPDGTLEEQASPAFEEYLK